MPEVGTAVRGDSTLLGDEFASGTGACLFTFARATTSAHANLNLSAWLQRSILKLDLYKHLIHLLHELLHSKLGDHYGLPHFKLPFQDL